MRQHEPTMVMADLNGWTSIISILVYVSEHGRNCQ